MSNLNELYLQNDGRRDVNTMTGHALNQRTMLDGMILTETSGGNIVLYFFVFKTCKVDRNEIKI